MNLKWVSNKIAQLLSWSTSRPIKKKIINQIKYIKDLKKSKIEDIKTMKTLMSLFIKLNKDEQGQSINHTLS